MIDSRADSTQARWAGVVYRLRNTYQTLRKRRLRLWSASIGLFIGAERYAKTRRDVKLVVKMTIPPFHASELASTYDALRSIEEANELVRAIPGASLQLFDDSGHMIPLEQPRELAAAVVSWLDTLGIQ